MWNRIFTLAVSYNDCATFGLKCLLVFSFACESFDSTYFSKIFWTNLEAKKAIWVCVAYNFMREISTFGLFGCFSGFVYLLVIFYINVKFDLSVIIFTSKVRGKSKIEFKAEKRIGKRCVKFLNNFLSFFVLVC
jgi:hypothetical protein